MTKKVISILAAVLVFAGLQSPVLAEEHGKPPVEELEQQFVDLIYQETAEDQEVQNYDALGALKQDLQGIMMAPLADHYLEEFFYEENDNLYLTARDGPIQLNTEEDYQLEQVNDTTYKLTQTSSNELHGDYTLTITYSYEAGRWVFADRMGIVGYSDNGGELPETATSNPAMVLFGITVIGAGALMMLRRRFTTE